MMKNNKFIITSLFILLCLQTLKAQETFLKIYPSNNNKEIYSIIESDDQHLIFCGVMWNNPEKTESIGTMMKIGMNGAVIDSSNYDFENGNSHFSELINPLTPSDSYLLSGSQDSISSNVSYNTVFIHTIENELNIVTRRNYGMWTDTTNTPWDFDTLGDTTAYILSFFETENSSLLYNYSLIKAHLINREYEYLIADNITNKAISSLIIDEVSELIKINYRAFLTATPRNPISKISYELTDIEVVMPENDFFSQTKLAKTNDSTYFLSGNVYENNTLNLGIAEYDLNDSLLNLIMLRGEIGSVTYPGMGKTNILATSDYIWVLGFYNAGELLPPCISPPSFIMLNKLNYNLDLIQQIFYGGDGVYYPKDLIETNGNHIVVAGDFYDISCNSYPFVLKVNSEGLIVNNGNINMPQAQEAIVVPNPGKDFLQIKLGIQHKTSQLQLFDINGRLYIMKDNVTDMQRIDTSALPKGVYPYKIMTGSKVVGTGKWIKD